MACRYGYEDCHYDDNCDHSEYRNSQRAERSTGLGLLLIGVGAVSCCIPGLQGVGAVAIGRGALKIGTAAATYAVREKIRENKNR